MKRFYHWSLGIMLLLSVSSFTPIKKLYVRLSNAQQALKAKNDGVIRLYLDRYGCLYPDVAIVDQAFINSYGLLENVFKNNRSLYRGILSRYGLPAGTTADQLQAQLIKTTVKEINEAGAGKQLVFLIHGYNNDPLLPEGNGSAHSYEVLRSLIANKYKERALQFVEIYWDGCTDQYGQTFAALKIWDHAQPASMYAGLELRRILNKLTNDNNIIITHSLGASVVTCALFNVHRYNNETFYSELESLYEDISFATPTKRFRVGMVAPAIPGQNTFDDYSMRTPAGTNIYGYYFVAGFNPNDRVLMKYRISTKHFGATSLGCRSDEVAHAQKEVNRPGYTILDAVDFSENNVRQKSHAFTDYIANPNFQLFLEKLFR